MNKKDQALNYHRSPRPGKIEVVPTKPCLSQSDLSLAYTPGVAVPCKEIERDPDLSYDYTARGNLVAIATNGTAVLGLGNIGPLASKPVMEGKSVLFKRFADIDAFDIELATSDPDEFINAVALLEPTFGGINLEDIKAPDCFYIEQKLIERMSIPVFHDDQHGTAIISGAALLNACEISERRIQDARIVINGAGAAAIACARMYIELGARAENLLMLDSRGVIHSEREQGMNPYKQQFAVRTKLRTLEHAARDADVLVGLSVAGAFSPELLKLMAPRPIVFALANPDPEIDFNQALSARPDAIVATGRSDYPNQVNNVLGFPFIFRGALDARATAINMQMKVAAVRALAELAREDVLDSVIRAYGGRPIAFGPEYILPKPLDSRVLLSVTPAVARAAVQSNVARIEPEQQGDYIQVLESRLGPDREIMYKIQVRAQQSPRRIVLPEGDHPVVLRAAHQAAQEGIAQPVLLGNAGRIEALAQELHIPLDGLELLDHCASDLFDDFSEKLFAARGRKGWTMGETRRQLESPFIFGAMMVREGLVEGQVHGISSNYPDSIRPVLQVIPRREGASKVSGVYLAIFKGRLVLLADATVNIHPDSEQLAEIALLAAEVARFFDLRPRVALLSFSNFGSVAHPEARRVRRAVQILHERDPHLPADGEMHADTAVVEEYLQTEFPFNRLGGAANVLIFPGLDSCNIAYKLLARIGGAVTVGPLLMGLSRPFNVVQRGTDMENVVNVIAITVAQAQERGARNAAP
ncbi:MAG: NADP-dependent malic enzyme [Candidatus Alcyoniella australis]|nr:NADP-dependent malic enzyme [Candidatus Alcyoniella australis]